MNEQLLVEFSNYNPNSLFSVPKQGKYIFTQGNWRLVITHSIQNERVLIELYVISHRGISNHIWIEQETETKIPIVLAGNFNFEDAVLRSQILTVIENSEVPECVAELLTWILHRTERRY